MRRLFSSRRFSIHRFKPYLATAAAVAGLLLAVLLALPYFIPLGRVQQAAAVKISSLTGQDVTFSGASRRFSFPLPVFTLRNVQIAGGVDATALLRAPKIDTQLSLFSLLKGEIEPVSLTVIEPKITLSTAADGRSNWKSRNSLLVMFDPQYIAAHGQVPVGLRVGEVRIVDGTISFAQDGAQNHTKFTAVNINLYWPDISKRFAVQGSLLRDDLPMRFSAMLRQPSALFRNEISPFELSIDTSLMKADMSGDLFAVPQLQADATLTFTSPSLRDLARLSLRNTVSVPDIGKISAKARFRYKDNDLMLDDAKLNMGDSHAEGTLSLKSGAVRTALQGTLDFDTIDLRPFLASQIGNMLNLQSTSKQSVNGDLSVLDMDLRISGKTLLLGKARIEDAALSVLTRSDRVELSLGDGKVYNGQMTGRLVTENRHGGGVKTFATLGLTDVRIDDALREMSGIVSLTGIGDLSLSVAGEGGSVSDIASSLQGDARIRIKDGSIAGINMSALMKRARENPVDAFLNARTGNSEIDSAIARFTIKDGVATTQDAVVLGPGYHVDLGGKAILAERKLDMSGKITPPLDAKELFELPFVIRGPWDNPVIVPNPGALVKPADAAPN